MTRCSICEGFGRISNPLFGNKKEPKWSECPDCGGTGIGALEAAEAYKRRRTNLVYSLDMLPGFTPMGSIDEVPYDQWFFKLANIMSDYFKDKEITEELEFLKGEYSTHTGVKDEDN